MKGEMDLEVEGSRTGFEFPFWNPLRRCFGPDFPFFEAGNLERELLAKQCVILWRECSICPFSQKVSKVEIISSIDCIGFDRCGKAAALKFGRCGGNSEVFCPIVGCGAHLKSLEEFEDHYNARHRASCSICSKVFPTSRLLSLHVSESHDFFFQAKVSRGFAMYECLVEGCGAKLMNYKSRQQHLIDKHKFPASFEFKKANPSKKHRQKFLHKKGSVEASSAANVEEDSMDTLVSVVSRLSTSDSPSSISFGRRHTRGFAFVPRAVEKERRQPGRSPAHTK